ncbi:MULTISPECIES: TetR/AcrR family transcriptional regulator [Pseudomonas]|uniref:Transcriptional regulator, TetR family n=1 Tax=Pseudomonas putida (strain W619) TaxID=390235 RepID=B1J783_PSEPW|nr:MULTISPECIES: TetR/AcrR family transcriptional regulator [Pseudomonas]MDH1574687.1 TetR/AcrR family transcriptional regulator [Pseudomonas sp. GD03746]QQE86080.1 TetR/AcrR family transcriptional regulator [Pseudomonas putida]UTL83075.1 TetR/AcrR family transcriptional regulator [Pseudomonas putida]HEN8711092.1 TetR/AcrR family transcriptional regulator [Pseudomonas putida]HEN8714770.1 TetR/AcrR family transcriptional regulator [Pseudomonas putida]
MSGLREQQKAMRRETISRTALGLFEAQGYQTTTMEQIARLAAVSVPTVFAYFGSKQEILLEKLREADHRAVTQARRRLPEFEDALDALCCYEEHLTDYAFAVLPAPLWREILPPLLPLLGGDQQALPAAYKRVNDALVEELKHLLQDLCDSGKLRADLDVGYAAFLINDYGHLQLLRLCNSETLDMPAHRTQVRMFMAILLAGMRG